MIASASAWRSTTLTCLLYLWWVVCMVRKKRGKETEREGERGRERNFFIAFDDIKRHISISKRIQLICRFSLECWKFLGIGRRIRTKINEFSSMKWTRKNGSISSTVETTNEKPHTTLFRRETINDVLPMLPVSGSSSHKDGMFSPVSRTSPLLYQIDVHIEMGCEWDVVAFFEFLLTFSSHHNDLDWSAPYSNIGKSLIEGMYT